MSRHQRLHRAAFAALAVVGVLLLLPTERGVAVPGETKLFGSDQGEFNSVGDSVGVSGDVVVVGAPLHGYPGDETGAVYVFERGDGTWPQKVKLQPEELGDFDRFGWSCAVQQGWIAVGAFGHDAAAPAAGAVWLYFRGSGGWTMADKLVASDAETALNFGESVAFDGPRLVVGAEHQSGPGAVYVFEPGDGWVEVAKLVPDDEDHLGLGKSVAVSGDTVIAGAPETGDKSNLGGAAYVWREVGGVWSQEAKIHNPISDAGRFGWSVAISGDDAFIGAIFTGNGEVYHYRRTAGDWSLVGELPRSATGDRRGYGSQVAMHGDRAIIGAYGDSLEASNAGAAYLYERVGGSWTETARVSSEDDRVNQQYGVAVGLDDTSFVVGAPGDDTVIRGSGAAYVFAGGEPPVPVIRSFLLPTSLEVRSDVGRRSRPTVQASGIFDTGPDEMDFTAPAEVAVGPTVLQIPGLSRKKGRKERYGYEGQGLDLTVTPSKLGTSKAKFSLKFIGTLAEAVDPNGEFLLRYTGSVADAEGRVQLEDGKFRFAGKAGLLLAPELDIRKAKAKLPGVGRHSFKFVAGFTTGGGAPSSARDCRVQFGDVFTADLSGAAFKSKKGDYVLREPVGGVTTAIVSYAKERITVKGKRVELGDVPEGPATLLLVLTLGGEERAVEVRAVRRKKVFKY